MYCREDYVRSPRIVWDILDHLSGSELVEVWSIGMFWYGLWKISSEDTWLFEAADRLHSLIDHAKAPLSAESEPLVFRISRVLTNTPKSIIHNTRQKFTVTPLYSHKWLFLKSISRCYFEIASVLAPSVSRTALVMDQRDRDMMDETQPTKLYTRRPHRKTKTGCLSCKRRKIKVRSPIVRRAASKHGELCCLTCAWSHSPRSAPP
jgi:hypothetical protein